MLDHTKANAVLKLRLLAIIILPLLLTGFACGQELEKVLAAKTFTPPLKPDISCANSTGYRMC